LGSAADFLKSEPDQVAAISIDTDTSDKIVRYFHEMKVGLENNDLQNRIN